MRDNACAGYKDRIGPDQPGRDHRGSDQPRVRPELRRAETSAADTIFAFTTGPGAAPVACLRLSGPNAGPACERLTGRPPPPPRRTALRWLIQPETSERFDQALMVFFRGPESFTGEDVLEIHCHGGRGVRALLLQALAVIPGCRPAEPGEFSRRAFVAGRIDLTAAEGIADLIEAETAGQVRQAVRQVEGRFARDIDGVRDRLLQALARIEAEIDFAPDQDLPEDLVATVRTSVGRLRAHLVAMLDDAGRGERLREGLTVAVIGAPNAGKSSLVNALACRDVAIVTAEAGTTRDVIEVGLDLGGVPVTLLDTAGLRDDVADAAEREGIRRARERAGSADLRLLVVDGAALERTGCATSPPGRACPSVDPNAAMEAQGGPADEECFRIVSKVDLCAVRSPPEAPGCREFRVSTVTGEGLPDLVQALTSWADARIGGGDALITRARHRTALEETVDALGCFLDGDAGDLGLLAEDLRLAAQALGRVTGRVTVEDLLDRVFAEFCIGK